MKDILDYPIDTKGSDLPQEILALHVSRCEKRLLRLEVKMNFSNSSKLSRAVVGFWTIRPSLKK